jgi:hypothetical protein
MLDAFIQRRDSHKISPGDYIESKNLFKNKLNTFECINYLAVINRRL